MVIAFEPGRHPALASPAEVALLLAGASTETTPRQADRIVDFAELLPRGSRVNVTFLVGSDFEETIRTARRLKPDGMVFAAAMGLYAVGRFWTMFFRDENQYVLDLVQAQLISVLILVVVVPLLLARARLAEAAAEPAGPAVRVPRAQRRRRR